MRIEDLAARWYALSEEVMAATWARLAGATSNSNFPRDGLCLPRLLADDPGGRAGGGAAAGIDRPDNGISGRVAGHGAGA
jgi:hypothetical protein